MAYRFECERGSCQFLVRSSSSEEVKRLVRAHARTIHGGRIDPADVDRCMERIESA